MGCVSFFMAPSLVSSGPLANKLLQPRSLSGDLGVASAELTMSKRGSQSNPMEPVKTVTQAVQTSRSWFDMAGARESQALSL